MNPERAPHCSVSATHSRVFDARKTPDLLVPAVGVVSYSTKDAHRK
jgi:hypothetical protein